MFGHDRRMEETIIPGPYCMFYILEKCISSVNANISQILDNLNVSSCVKLRRKTETVSPEVIPPHANTSCVTGSPVSIAQEVPMKEHRSHDTIDAIQRKLSEKIKYKLYTFFLYIDINKTDYFVTWKSIQK